MITYFQADSTNKDLKTIMNLQLLSLLMQVPFFNELQQKADF